MIKKRIVKPTGILTAESALKNAGHDVTVDWNNCFAEKLNTRAPVTCNKHLTTVSRNVCDLKQGKYKCVDCVEDTRAENVNKSGFSLVQKVSDKKHIVCCNTCGENKVVGVTQLYTHKGIFCESCSTNKYKKILEDNNCTYLYRYKRGACIILGYKDQGGVERETASSELARLKFKHKQQYDTEKYKQLVEDKGFDFVDKAGKARARVKCRVDGAERDVCLSVIREGKILCYTCRHKRVEAELSKRGCTFVKYAKVKYIGNKAMYANAQGEFFTASVVSIQSGKFATTNEGHWFARHSTYLIKLIHNANVYYKIGTAIHPDTRMRHLKLLGEAEVFTLKDFDNRPPADKLEKELHREFELFKLNSPIAAGFTMRTINRKRTGHSEKVAVKDGIHEWFSGEEVFQTLAARYNLKEKINGTDSNTNH
jgi:hypothetical protein